MSLTRAFATSKKPMPCFKYFINKTTVLQQYREALKQANTVIDPDLRVEMQQFMRDEFAPFRKFRTCYE
jgi:hypothetical protein